VSGSPRDWQSCCAYPRYVGRGSGRQRRHCCERETYAAVSMCKRVRAGQCVRFERVSAHLCTSLADGHRPSADGPEAGPVCGGSTASFFHARRLSSAVWNESSHRSPIRRGMVGAKLKVVVGGQKLDAPVRWHTAWHSCRPFLGCSRHQQRPCRRPRCLALLGKPRSMRADGGLRGEKEDTSMDMQIDRGKSRLRKIEADTVASR
jgi:hypothetical protein